MTDRVAALKKKIEAGEPVELWHYVAEKPGIAPISHFDEQGFTITYEDNWGETQSDYVEYESDWLDSALLKVEIYNSPLGQALR